MTTTRHVLALDLVDDAALIADYDAHHVAVWPEVEAQILSTGVLSCEIWRLANRLVMVLEVPAEGFSLEAKAAADAAHEPTQRWEAAMSVYQRALPCAALGQKWVPMHKVYDLRRASGQQAASGRQPAG
jgi:L-rhamnose mutarotase